MQIVSHFHSRKQVMGVEKFSLFSACPIPPAPQLSLLWKAGDSTAETSRCANVEEFAVYFMRDHHRGKSSCRAADRSSSP